MRFLFVSINPIEWGGSEELWWTLAAKTLDNQHPTMVSVFSRQAKHDKLQKLKQKGTLIHKRPLPSFVREQSFVKRAWAEFKSVLKLDYSALDWVSVLSFKPDVVVISSGETFDHYLHHKSFIVQYCLKNNIPYFLISQRNWEHDIDVTEYYRNSRRLLTSWCKGHFFVSYRNYQQACRQLAMEIPQARIVQNPLLVNLRNNVIYPGSEVPTLAVVARLHSSIKGQDVLLQALSSKDLINKPFLLTFYGVGKDLHHLQSLVEHYGLEEKVRFAGHVPNIHEVWENNQILVLTSLVEGTPLSLIEAMASGRTAIVTPVGDNSIWLSDLGYVASGTGVEQITHILKSAIEDSSNWEKKGIACKERIAIKYNQEELSHLYECISGTRNLDCTGANTQNYLLQMQY
jgi:glycosyltransferase involved in cell wall biosynthesis